MNVEILNKIKHRIGNNCEVAIRTNEFGLYIQVDWYDGSDYHVKKQLSQEDLMDEKLFIRGFVADTKKSHDRASRYTTE